MKEAYNKFSKEKIIDICNKQNINYIKHYWNTKKIRYNSFIYMRQAY